MTSEVRSQKFHTGDGSDLDSASDWSCSVGNLLQLVRSTTQIVASSVWNACSSDVIREETSGDFAKGRLFSLAKINDRSSRPRLK